MIRIATFNLENLFTRPVAMSEESAGNGSQAIEDHALANTIVNKAVYSVDDKNTLLQLTQKYKWHRLNPPRNALVQLNKVRGQLFRDPTNGPVQVVADGRADWVGWFELLRENVTWRATYNTGLVIQTVRPNIMIAVEVESRPTLERFNKQVLGALFDFAYPHCMVIDGNDQRGIDLGILSKYPIAEIRTHTDEYLANDEPLFSRDCPEYDILLSSGERIILIPNHFKSKRGGNNQASVDKRQAQAERAHAIAQAALERSPLVLLGGDLNDTPESDTLTSLFTNGFLDVMSHPSYPVDRPGTYQTGLASQKIDYLIMSPQLRTLLQDTGIERRGSYHPHTWEPFDSVTNSSEEASDHHLVWADFNL